MFLASDHGDGLDPVDRKIVADIRSVYDRLPVDSRMGVSIRGANHFSFTDQWLLRSHLFRKLLTLRLEPRRRLAITTEAVRRFLDVHLKGVSAESLQILPKTYPEVRFELP
jgi:hypothetical protein